MQNVCQCNVDLLTTCLNCIPPLSWVWEERSTILLIALVWNLNHGIQLCIRCWWTTVPHSTINKTQPLSRPIWLTSFPTNVRPVLSSCMDIIWREYTAAGISAEAAQSLLSGWSRDTNTTYQSAWKNWVSWCILIPFCALYRLPSWTILGGVEVPNNQHHQVTGQQCLWHTSSNGPLGSMSV